MASEQDPAALKRRRATIKSSCTRIKTYVDTITTVTPLVTAQLEERKIKLDDYWSEYNEVQSQLESIDSNEANDRVGFEEAFYLLSARIREVLKPATVSHLAINSPSSSHASNQPEGRVSVRLPKLNLPSFSGKYDEWFQFFDSFNSIIHLNTSISNVQKLQYLKSSLSGDASNVISSLEISDLNYEVAWNLLKERYDNKRVIVNTHIKAIMELPSMTKEDSAGLRRIADGATRHIHALRALKRTTNHWDDLLVHILSSKFDALTLREWQSSLLGSDPPTFKQFDEFINHRCQILEATSKTTNPLAKETNKRSLPATRRQASCVATVKPRCNYCNGEHAIYYCSDFLALPVSQRTAEARNRKVCINCLSSPTHDLSKCNSKGCRICKAKHNTLLHPANGTAENRNSNSKAPEETNAANSQTAVVTHASSNHTREHTMLSTAVVDAFAHDGLPVSCRVLLDCGSQANFISREFANTLGLQTRPSNVAISGINGSVTRSTETVEVKIQSRLTSYSATIFCIITDQITNKLPASTMSRSTYKLPQNLKLADPQFNVSSKIDMLIGAELFWELLCIGQIKSSPECPTLQKTQLGWILAGCLGSSMKPTKNVQSFHATISNSQLHDQLCRFWQIEDIQDATGYNREEAYCEEHFLNHTSQTAEGRYVVKLPVKESSISHLGNSRDIALKRLLGIEKRLARDPNLRIQYTQFMSEYLTLGHMRQANMSTSETTPSFYLPHHCVFKNSGQSTRIRIVFDASCKSDNGISLNDVLRVGPVVQQDLMSIVMRFRTFAYVLSADIVKMYRQVLVHPTQTSLQRILWRFDPTARIQTYELTTVTYGTSSASFLVTRCLKHLADQNSSEFPVGSTCVKRDFYVDDLLTGADSFQEAKIIRDEVTRLLKLGSFELSKWASNCPQLLNSTEHQSNEPIVIPDGVSVHILGIQWNQLTDTFHFSYDPEKAHDTVSKQSILSDVSKLFDPLGFLGQP